MYRINRAIIGPFWVVLQNFDQWHHIVQGKKQRIGTREQEFEDEAARGRKRPDA